MPAMFSKDMRYLELLAPARDKETGFAAIDCGADAVYIAGPGFGARQAAGNSMEDIRELCPTLSDSSIEGAFRKLIACGELKKEGSGKNTCYFRLN